MDETSLSNAVLKVALQAAFELSSYCHTCWQVFWQPLQESAPAVQVHHLPFTHLAPTHHAISCCAALACRLMLCLRILQLHHDNQSSCAAFQSLLLPRHSQGGTPGTHAEIVWRQQGGWANNNQWSLPAHTKAAILRAKLALRCCAAAALPFARVGQEGRAGRPAWAFDTRAMSWACQERASDLAKEVARFLRQFASRPLLIQLSTGCEAVAVCCYKAT